MGYDQRDYTEVKQFSRRLSALVTVVHVLGWVSVGRGGQVLSLS